LLSEPIFEVVKSPPTQSQVKVNVNYYSIYGSNVEQIRKALRTQGILSKKDGKRYAGLTQWFVQWRYHYQQYPQQCRLTNVTVNTTVTITLPQWKISTNPPQGLRLKWNQFSQALRKHEDNHKRHGLLAAQEISNTLQRFPPSSTCSQLEQKANQTAQLIIEKYQQADLLYDQKTRHGTTEGAVF
jgi:predicted secreted Zn-dependent protease